MKKRRQGFSLVEIMVVVVIIGLLTALAVPGFLRVREVSQRHVCINNLRLIQDSKVRWGGEERRQGTETPTEEELAAHLRGGFPDCPTNGEYTIHALNAAVTCSIDGHEIAGGSAE